MMIAAHDAPDWWRALRPNNAPASPLLNIPLSPFVQAGFHGWTIAASSLWRVMCLFHFEGYHFNK